ncbi:MAG: phytanoyl-CoA dioxygenase family protein [Burkholderiales bacterium]|nr:phytanoyl-CoA dioxygenase family protein [Burkholderiales bacterium]
MIDHMAGLHAKGFSIIPDFLDPAALTRVREALASHLQSHSGRNNFEGFKTERVYTLVARGKIFEDIAEDPPILAILDQLLQPGYLLTASQAICIHPGETPQPIHYDDSFYPIPRPRKSISISTIVAVDDFTEENGCTEVIPGSHLWSDEQVAGTYDGRDHDAPMPPEIERQLVPVVMPAGSCVVFHGTLMHRGGANRSAKPRLAFSNQYCEPWARTQENFFLGVPPDIVRTMSPRLQVLLGYEIMPPFMGHVTASHPRKVLAEGYVAPVKVTKSPSQVANKSMN